MSVSNSTREVRGMKRWLQVIPAALWLVGASACATDGEAPDELMDSDSVGGEDAAASDGDGGDDGEPGDGGDSSAASDGGEDGDDGTVASDGGDSGDGALDDGEDPALTGSFGKGCEDGEDDGDCEEATVATDPMDPASVPIVTDPPPAVAAPPPGQTWTPANGGVAPRHVSQSDLQVTCQRLGAGVNPGYVRFGCNAVRRDDGQHYGIVKGWWQVLRSDGVRSKAKDLNFREAGYDMAFDVPSADAAGGITVAPGGGEARVGPCNCQVTN
jgi:hypothetical protein